LLKNKYFIDDNKLYLYLNRRNKEPLITVVDLEDFKKLEDENVQWFSKWDEDIQSYYAQATKYLGKIDGKFRNKTLYLHKIILGYSGKNKIDHINHDTLDNRKENLRISYASEVKSYTPVYFCKAASVLTKLRTRCSSVSSQAPSS
jgi:hypothetical protein